MKYVFVRRDVGGSVYEVGAVSRELAALALGPLSRAIKPRSTIEVARRVLAVRLPPFKTNFHAEAERRRRVFESRAAGRGTQSIIADPSRGGPGSSRHRATSSSFFFFSSFQDPSRGVT